MSAASSTWSQADREAIEKYYGKPLEQLHPDEYKSLRKQLLAKYHPDNFEKFADDTVREMATERFQALERLNEKIELYFDGKLPADQQRERAFHPNAQFAFDKLKVEIITSDKDLKYHLFGTRYRWLLYGDSFRIPGTQASIIIDDNHRGASIGYRETIRMYLTFDTKDPVEVMVDWLYGKIATRADSLIVHGDVVAIDRDAILRAIKQTTFLQIGPAAGDDDEED